MTKKEFNTIGAAAYEAALKIPEVAEMLRGPEGVVFVYILQDGSEKRYVAINHQEQLNSNLYRSYGFNPETTAATHQFTVSRTAKCVYF